jgi:hypothetical protein
MAEETKRTALTLPKVSRLISSPMAEGSSVVSTVKGTTLELPEGSKSPLGAYYALTALVELSA